jgi:hypothetical protein
MFEASGQFPRLQTFETIYAVIFLRFATVMNTPAATISKASKAKAVDELPVFASDALDT